MIRLVVMAQGSSEKVLAAFHNLNEDDKQVLSVELARTARIGQSFQLDAEVPEGGPTFLIYYAPALMQKNSSSNAEGALKVLAEIFRQARNMWPLQEERADETVIVQIDMLKGFLVHELPELRQDEHWVLKRPSHQINGTVAKDILPKGFVDEPHRRLLHFSQLSTPTQSPQTSA